MPLCRRLLRRALVLPGAAGDGDYHVDRHDDLWCQRLLLEQVADDRLEIDRHRAALERAKACRDLLRERGWPEPIVGDSGNGAHLSYRVELPNVLWVRDLFKKALEALVSRLSDDAVSVDLTPHNAARIWKLYGTLACKGDSTIEHPYRRSRLLKVPEQVIPVSEALLDALASEAQERQAKKRESTLVARETSGSFDLDEWIARHGLAVEPCSAWQNGRKWIFRVCPWNAEHTNRSAFLIQFTSGAVAAGVSSQRLRGIQLGRLAEPVRAGLARAATRTGCRRPRQDAPRSPGCSRPWRCPASTVKRGTIVASTWLTSTTGRGHTLAGTFGGLDQLQEN